MTQLDRVAINLIVEILFYQISGALKKVFFLLIPSIKGTVFAVEMLFEKPKFYRIDKLPFRISTVYDLFNTLGIKHTPHPLFNYSVFTKYSNYISSKCVLNSTELEFL